MLKRPACVMLFCLLIDNIKFIITIFHNSIYLKFFWDFRQKYVVDMLYGFDLISLMECYILRIIG